MIIKDERIGGQRLLLGDCLEVMPLLGRFDAVVTDPPYGTRDEEWDAMNERQFAAFSMRWMAAANLPSAQAVLFGNLNNGVHKLAEMIYPRVRPMIWAKPPGSQLSGASECKRWFAYETIFHCHHGQTWEVVKPRDVDVGNMIRTAREAIGLSRGAVEVMLRGKKTGLCYRWEEGACLPPSNMIDPLKNALRMGREFDEAILAAEDRKNQTVKAARAAASANAAGNSDVLSYRTVTNGRHPCEKPIALMEELIGDLRATTILDPFMGSGTTLVACQKLGRQGTGIELDPDYFDIACKRVDEATRQPDMFVQAPSPAPTQESLL